MSSYQKLVDRYFPHDEETAEFEGGVPEATIAAAEAKLGVRFPPPLRGFLGDLGAATPDPRSLSALAGRRTWTSCARRSTSRRVQAALRAPAAPPRRLRQPRLPRRSTGGVVEWVHEAPFAERRVLAPDYKEWFESILELATDDSD